MQHPGTFALANDLSGRRQLVIAEKRQTPNTYDCPDKWGFFLIYVLEQNKNILRTKSQCRKLFVDSGE
jgi:hypothetical protein